MNDLSLAAFSFYSTQKCGPTASTVIYLVSFALQWSGVGEQVLSCLCSKWCIHVPCLLDTGRQRRELPSSRPCRSSCPEFSSKSLSCCRTPLFFLCWSKSRFLKSSMHWCRWEYVKVSGGQPSLFHVKGMKPSWYKLSCVALLHCLIEYRCKKLSMLTSVISFLKSTHCHWTWWTTQFWPSGWRCSGPSWIEISLL